MKKITKKEKINLLENIDGNVTWFNLNEVKIFKSIVSDITKIQPYFKLVSGLPDDTFIHQGMVLSDRILYDIPLPVRTHVG